MLDAPPGELPDLDGVPLGPRSSHDPARGSETLLAYRQWVARGGRANVPAQATPVEGTQAAAFTGDPAWSPERRFERVFERLALPGFARMGRYELLVTLGRLGLYELTPDSLQLAGARGSPPRTSPRWPPSACSASATRCCWSGARQRSHRPPRCRSRRSIWRSPTGSPQPATLGFPRETLDDGAFERAGAAFGL